LSSHSVHRLLFWQSSEMMGAPVLRIIVLVVAIASSAPAFAAGSSAEEQGRAQAEIVRPLVVTREQDLAFGAVFAGNVPGLVTVTASARVVYQGGVEAACVQGLCSAPHPASFLVRGEPGRSYRVEVPDSVQATGVLAGGSGPAAALTVAGLMVDTISTPGTGGSGSLDDSGQDRFTVGGTLQIPAQQPAANYRASVPVIVTYG